MPVTTPIGFNYGGLTCANPGSAVTPDYQAPFRFTGTRKLAGIMKRATRGYPGSSR